MSPELLKFFAEYGEDIGIGVLVFLTLVLLMRTVPLFLGTRAQELKLEVGERESYLKAMVDERARSDANIDRFGAIVSSHTNESRAVTATMLGIRDTLKILTARIDAHPDTIVKRVTEAFVSEGQAIQTAITEQVVRLVRNGVYRMQRAVIALQGAGDIASVNTDLITLLGYEPKELIGHSIHSVPFTCIRENGSTVQHTDLPWIKAITTRSMVANSLLGIKHRTEPGRWVWVLVDVQISYLEAEIIDRILVSFVDVGEMVLHTPPTPPTPPTEPRKDSTS